jgi:hypothetical protein
MSTTGQEENGILVVARKLEALGQLSIACREKGKNMDTKKIPADVVPLKDGTLLPEPHVLLLLVLSSPSAVVCPLPCCCCSP